ncbi:MAG: MFS transporter [Bacteroidetes bacterium]|nr:MAG: MFS transporter permease [Cryomorphaceae bacterium BACL29 MAG-121220-bin8]MDA0757944.1 MFS transporter [Bacteroidota bacterium]MDA1019006.1 MFS transporter [Bacteroidota bacterium]
MTKHNFIKGDSKVLNAWAFYDWANSVYPLVISSSVFPIYYGSLFLDDLYIDLFGFNFKNTALISFLTAFAFVVLSIITPLLSGVADYVGNKMSFLKFFCYSGSISCMGLYFFDIENIYMGLSFYFFALISFWASLVFYNSYLPDIAYKEQQDSLSAKGYALGYIGSVILLVFNLSMVLFPESFGISGDNPELLAMRYSFVSVGLWWMIFSQYTFYYLPKSKSKRKIVKHVFFNGFKELKEVWDELKQIVIIKRFLIAFFIYSSALQTVLLIATYFGEQEINWGEGEKTTGLIVSILLIQLVAVFGSIITAKVSKKIGNIQTLVILNFTWAFLCIGAYFIKSSFEFYIAAALVGMIMGGIQALSRSTFSKMIPETDNTTSYFSFYDVSQKVSIVFGMTLFAFVDQITGSMRISILIFIFIFLLGAFLLRRIKIKNY